MGQDTQFRALLEGSPDAIVMVDAERDRRASRICHATGTINAINPFRHYLMPSPCCLFSRRRQTSRAAREPLSMCSTESAAIPRGTVVAQAGLVPLDLFIGRALAWCVHPVAAWQRLPARGRVLLVAAYVSASYSTVLTLLFIG